MFWTGETIVRKFVDAVNHEDATGAIALLDENCVWIDSRDNRAEGAEECREALQTMFESDARFRIHIEEVVHRLDEYLISGHTESQGEHHTSRVLWRAKVSNGRLTNWQSYRDAETPSVARLFPANSIALD